MTLSDGAGLVPVHEAHCPNCGYRDPSFLQPRAAEIKDRIAKVWLHCWTCNHEVLIIVDNNVIKVAPLDGYRSYMTGELI